ncbi:FAD-dependent oxidoreductase [bacterium (Candidatus Blackallbacteria) CG17_big_fil_post_rev_8_21_14_2_50_48_46]|uniref:FAD-dependent oxidoreductase n=1 Tax=bacterium (Candidatus Blackallbacteria) CG17_big_fil_post_rev_8_21_14_2_50_48_46 TaxID=2014261 RepID=A0A2M7G5E6_9BACT|nr:MAG: FAD-dependent oxidoreductase [bacterium (Candidatus Blackallbacteria) CG18_big_fil_WC_8_21_14_2_50_49_26]PIW17165.1 MAG: FAD-dependent oxidoreductase [bacterium (Candidatus Blackallbacteria) CG17_big_fil_post_rev_8_21_14_2_50_48_46]PIW44491.1 MAG: FAD-dependent oxidoreductase [bacterium (Candidatus Blackallbacteria) CG13_big_fil_rev_8_21_14_2_50_49_14]
MKQAEMKLPYLAECDVLVLGGGSAGAAAAIAAARSGARTILVEQNGFLGGTSTAALVTPMMANHLQEKPLNQGIYLEVLNTLLETGDAAVYKDGNAGWFNPEMLKLVLEQKAVEAGVRLFYHVYFSEAVVEDRVLKGVVVETKSGRGMIAAEVCIDASGDADLAFQAGVPMVVGRPEDHANQPMALRFNLGHVDLIKARDYFASLGEFDWTDNPHDPELPLWTTACTWDKSWPLSPVFQAAVAAGDLSEDDAAYFQIFTVPGRPGEVAFNCPRMDQLKNSLDFQQRSQVQVEGKQRILKLWRFCQHYLPGFEKSFIAQIAPMPGIRESRRIVGEYVLSSEDFFAARKFPDAIARNNYPIDIHSRDKSGGLHFMKAGDYHEIPFRCLLPLEIENLLVAGRCLSADFAAQGAVRIIPNCYAMGQAAGTAAALAVQQACSPRELDSETLMAALQTQQLLA